MQVNARKKDIGRRAAFGQAIDTIEIGSWQNIDDVMKASRRAVALLQVCVDGMKDARQAHLFDVYHAQARTLKRLIVRCNYVERAAHNLAKKARALDPVF